MSSEILSFSTAALLFDMDGTLVDSTEVVDIAWRMFAERFDIDPAILLPQIRGRRAEELVQRWAPPGTDVQLVVDELTAFEVQEAGRTLPIPGASAFVQAVPLHAHALVTSAPLALALARLHGARIRVPGLVLAAEDVHRGKPEPDAFLLAAQLLDISPREAVVFEDSEAGIRAGRRAGMRVIVVGPHRSAATRELPHIDSYDGATVALDQRGMLRVTLRLAAGSGTGNAA